MAIWGMFLRKAESKVNFCSLRPFPVRLAGRADPWQAWTGVMVSPKQAAKDFNVDDSG